ncbi:cysteine proteinase [Gymnopus androsaceus JB14]|uniref:Cysteine proteinase n=1 Tax=Gymnopus androsaceus JB14 TaxID=1447944 RepID=A0A6A4GIT2_9AGAR|nr:cysteine proteinase [Gymnopus androsaceus JB14]
MLFPHIKIFIMDLLGLAHPCDSSCESKLTALGTYPLCMVEPVETVLKAIQGITEYIPAMQELFTCTLEVNIDKELDYQATLQWGWSLPKKDETQNHTSTYLFNVLLYPRIRAASHCLRLIETAVDISSKALHSAADKHNIQTTKVLVAFQQMLVLKRSLQCILKMLFSAGRFILTEIPDFAKEISKLIIDPLRTLTAFDIDFGRIKEVKLKDFLLLDREKYINDEVMNYFCVKWTRRQPTKRVIALTTFFSAKVLFEHGNPRGEVYDRLSEDSLKYCKAAKVFFVPIHEPSGHWYSALIDYEGQKIEIFDSWGATYEKNSGRDVKDQKHAPLMLVLMWAAELWSSIRGVEPTDKPTVLLGDNKDSGWTFDPHALVAFQDNCFDCGIHVLDHLDRILRGENLNWKDKPSMDHRH